MSQTVRFFTKALLVKAAAIAAKRGYNRGLSQEFLDNLPDSFKYPVCHHFVHQHKAGKLCEPHIRAGFAYDTSGICALIDCDWNLFYDLPLWQECQTQSGGEHHA